MHGFGEGYTFFVNAEVDSMGGVVDGGVGFCTNSSPRRVEIEKAQSELRLEYDVREERRRELEFLEKGGNPLDFMFAASVTVPSTSHTDQQPDPFLTSEAKGSFALSASPHGDSVESSGRLGVTTACEPNSADNFDGENELRESERKSIHPVGGSITPSEYSSQLEGSQHNKDSEYSPVFHPKKGQAYIRRNRSRTNRDGPRSSSVDVASRGSHGLSLPNRQGVLSKPIASKNHFEMESDGTNASTSKEKEEELQNQSSKAEELGVTGNTAEPELVVGKENVVPLETKYLPCSGIETEGDNATTVQLNESGKMNGDGKYTHSEGPIVNAVQTMKGVESESSCTQISLNIDGNGIIDRELCTNLKNVNSNEAAKEDGLMLNEKKLCKEQKGMSENLVTNGLERDSCINENQTSINHQGNGFADKAQEYTKKERSSVSDDGKGHSNVREAEANNHFETKSDIQTRKLENSMPQEHSCSVGQIPSMDPSRHEPDRTYLCAPPAMLPQNRENKHKVIDKAHEDRILEEAQIIEAKHKRIAELSTGLLPREYRRKSHWDFVVEEMTWLANDFAQERLWKITAAAQVSHRVAFASRLRLEEQKKCWKQKSVAHKMANAVMAFWHSAKLLVENVNGSESEKCVNDEKTHDLLSSESKDGCPDKDNVSKEKLQSHERKQNPAVHCYAIRFLQSNGFVAPAVHTEVHERPDVGSDICLPEYSQQDPFTEENFLYVVPFGAMETYRKSIESCLTDAEITGNNMQEEVDTSMYDAAAELDFEEDEGENVYYMAGEFDSKRPSKKKRKSLKSYAAGSHDCGGDLDYNHCMDNRNGTPRSIIIGKRPSNNIHVGSIPTKKMRTASRQRVVGSFNPGPAGVTPSRPDVSSGDTNSFQDDQSTLHGGAIQPRGSEVASAMDFEKQSTFDSIEVSAKPKKKKKIKHQGSPYDQRWQLECAMPNEQNDHVRKREGYQLDSNGNNGLLGQHSKKPKMTKHSFDSSFDNILPMSGSIASPVASQMSNMSNQSKIIKLIGGRDRSKKAKTVKGPAGQTGLGSPWSLFEDQALVVLVHDMGPNWELVSDAINSTLQFKCIFRKPQECKERHKVLMDRSCSDGADSAEDSGSSQPYPSTLPGIPKGSARQLFQRLQEPVEEDTIKSHFEKIICIGQQLHYRRNQINDLDLKQVAPVHGSHVVALSQVFPNNVNGGILTPLDLCDVSSNQDLLPLGYQGTHAGGLGLANQGGIPSMHPPNGLNSSFQGVQGSPTVGISNNTASTSQFNSPRDARLSGLRPGSLHIDEQQRLQQYNHLVSGRNVQSANMLSSGALSGTERGVPILPGGNSVVVMAGMNRTMPLPRPGLQGMASTSMLNSGNMLPGNVSVHPGAASTHGNSMFRACDALQMARPGHSSEHQRQMMVPEMQMQGTQGNSSGVTSFGGMNSGFSSQATQPVQAYPGHHHQNTLPMSQQHSHVLSSPHLPGPNHPSTPEQQAILRLREKQLQQRWLQRQHPQLPSSSASITHAQTPDLLPISSPVQCNSQVQPETSQPASLSPLSPSSPMTQSQQQQKHQVPSHGLGQSVQSSASGMVNQAGKQRRQPQQQSSRQHPQQRQLSQSQQHAKILKGIGRSNVVMNQNISMDPSHLNGISAKPGGQLAGKGEQPVHLVQGQNLHSGAPLNMMHQSKASASPTSNNSQNKKPYTNTVAATMKEVQQIPSHLESSNQGQVPAVVSASSAMAASNQGVSSAEMPSLSHHQLQGHLKPPVKVANKPPATLQRPIHQSRNVNSDPLVKSQANHTLSEQQFSNRTSKGNASSISTTCVDSTSVVPLSSSAGTAARKPQESVCDSALCSSTSPGPMGSPALANSSGSEPSTSVSQCQVQRQSGNLVSHGHSVGSQWQQKSLLHQPPSLQPILAQSQSQQPIQLPEHSPQHQVPQQQSKPQVQPGKGGVLAKDQ